MKAGQFTKMTFSEKLDMKAKEQERKQRKEYARVIAYACMLFNSRLFPSFYARS
jgi:hypothetical protein